VLDTNPLQLAVYALHYFGRCPDWLEREARSPRYDLYLLCDVDVPWVADPQRDRPHDRVAMHALFVSALDARGLAYFRVSGLGAARLLAARQALVGAGLPV
jgi:nicotinamide riboside kinase